MMWLVCRAKNIAADWTLVKSPGCSTSGDSQQKIVHGRHVCDCLSNMYQHAHQKMLGCGVDVYSVVKGACKFP